MVEHIGRMETDHTVLCVRRLNKVAEAADYLSRQLKGIAGQGEILVLSAIVGSAKGMAYLIDTFGARPDSVELIEPHERHIAHVKKMYAHALRPKVVRD